MSKLLKPSARPVSTNVLVLVVCLAQFMVILDVSIVNVALPSIGRGLHFSTTGLSWVINAYTITFAGLLLLGGRATDLLGRKPIFIAGTAMFSVFSLMAAVSDSQTTLLIARGLQGVAAALMSPASLSIITTHTAEGPERTRALGVWASVAGLGASSGALLGGVLTQGIGWPAIFAVNVPVGLAVVLAARRVIPAHEARDIESERHFDALGATLVTAGLATFAFAIVRTATLGWISAGVLVPLAAALVMLGGFIYVERSVSHWPLMPLSIFKVQRVRWANTIIVLSYAGLFSMFYFITLFLQQIQGHDAIIAGVSFLPTTLGVFFSSNRASRVIARFGLRTTAVAGLLLSAAGLLYLSTVGPGSDYLTGVLPGLVLAGLGMGTTLVSGTVAATQGVPSNEAGLASGLLNTSRMVGGALGLAVLSTIAASVTRGDLALGHAVATTNGYNLALLLGAALSLLGAGVAAAKFGGKTAVPVVSLAPRAVREAERVAA
jgi:EmrB/QacA subfamily drug resistance transporter